MVKSELAPSMAPVRPVEYRLADSAKAPARSATAYQLRKVGDVAARVAKALGVPADDIDGGSGYGDWWYSNDEGGDVAMSSVAAPDCPPNTKCEAPEPMPVPKLEGVPLPEDAKAKAKAILDELGVSVSDDDLEVQGDDGPFRTVTYVPSIDGVPVPMMTSAITFGAHSQIQYANGFLFRVDEVGDYPLVSLADAFDRYQHGFGGGVEAEDAVGRPEPVPATMVDTGEATSGSGSAASSSGVASGSAGAATEPVPPSTTEGGAADCAADGPGCGVSGSPGSSGSGVIEPMPAETPPVTLEPEIVEVTHARLVLEPVATGCLDDPVYLVPAFELLLDGEDQSIGTVTAVTDDAVDQGDPAETDARVCPEDEVGDEPAGKPEPAPVPPDAGSVEPQPARNP
jgi:hypothetical protein